MQHVKTRKVSMRTFLSLMMWSFFLPDEAGEKKKSRVWNCLSRKDITNKGGNFLWTKIAQDKVAFLDEDLEVTKSRPTYIPSLALGGKTKRNLGSSSVKSWYWNRYRDNTGD